MKRASRVGVGLLLLVLIAGGAAWALRGPITLALMTRVFERFMNTDPLAELPDGLHVGLCGSGSPMPDPTRAGPCVVVVAGRQVFTVDAGQGSTRNLSLMDLPPPLVSGVFLTHYHSDHIADLGEMMLQRWAGGAHADPLPVYGPTGVDEVVHGFEAAYQLDKGYRVAHHGPQVVPPSGFGGAPHPFAVDRNAPDVLVIDEPDLKVWAFPVEHHPAEPAVGYLFVYKGRRVAISGDTAPSPRLEAAAHGADVLLHEGLSPKLVGMQRKAALAAHRDNYAAILHDILSYHSTPEQAAGLAQRAGVRLLVFYHEIPPLPVRTMDGPFLGDAAKIYHGPIQVGRDGDFISLPAGTRDIRRTNRMNIFFQAGGK